MSLSDRIHHAKHQLNLVLEELAKVPDKSTLVDLFAALENIERHYIEFCASCDEGQEPGSTYRDGISLEFYIEADWWHDVSVALRKLKQADGKLGDIWCPHVGGLGPPFPYCDICAKEHPHV